MRPTALNKIRWILVVLTPLIFVSLMLGDSINWKMVYEMILMILWLLLNILMLIFFIYKRTTISSALRQFLIILIPASILFVLFGNYVLEHYNFSNYTVDFGIYTLRLSIVLCFIIYLEKIEIILIGFLVAIVVGFILNRYGLSEGEYILSIAFCLSSIGFLYLSFKSWRVIRENKTRGRILIPFFIVIGVLNALFFIKFTFTYSPVFSSVYDTIGVVIFLLACLALFIVLPFSNFVEWSKSQKQTFKRLILFPFILFLLIFSLRFLLPENTYRQIFFKDYTGKEINHFGMEDYKLDFTKK